MGVKFMKTINKTRVIWKCKHCGDVVISYSHIPHDINYCDCGKSAVDLDGHYQGHKGSIEIISTKEYICGKWVKFNE